MIWLIRVRFSIQSSTNGFWKSQGALESAGVGLKILHICLQSIVIKKGNYAEENKGIALDPRRDHRYGVLEICTSSCNSTSQLHWVTHILEYHLHPSQTTQQLQLKKKDQRSYSIHIVAYGDGKVRTITGHVKTDCTSFRLPRCLSLIHIWRCRRRG